MGGAVGAVGGAFPRTNAAGYYCSAYLRNLSFDSDPCEQTLSVADASNVTASSATLGASSRRRPSSSIYAPVYFEYGTTPSLGTATVSSFTPASLTGLAASTIYYYRAATLSSDYLSPGGILYGPTQSFTTGAGDPPAINGTTLTVATVGQQYSGQVIASGGVVS